MTSAADIERLAELVHEVRSPVAALSAIAETFRDESLDCGARRELAALAITACRGIERVVVDEPVASVRFEHVDVGALARQAAAATSLGGAAVVSKVAADLPQVAGDPLRLRQALDNLIANALTHSGSEGEVVVSVVESGFHVLLSVSDSGTGVPIADQERIFQAGVRLDPERAGSGIGLATTRTIAEAHRGTLTVSSIPGEGATFTIALPLR